MADAILRYVRRGTVESTLLLGEHEAEVLHLRVPEQPATPSLVKLPLKDLTLPKDSLIGAVIRGADVIIGSGDTLLRPGDELLVVSRPEALRKLEKLFC